MREDVLEMGTQDPDLIHELQNRDQPWVFISKEI